MNIIVIVTDSLRADYVGHLGGKAKTPNLDKFAKQSTVFEQAYTESLPTMPTRTTWWTGKTNFPFRAWQPLETWDYLLAEILWSQGYTSALISDTYHMHKPSYNCGRGFDYVSWIRGQEYDPWIVDTNIKVNINKWFRIRKGEKEQHWKTVAEQYLRNISVRKTEEDYFVARVIKETIRWLEYITKKQKDRLFLWVDCFDPHEPWDPPEPYWSMYKPKNYRGTDIIDPVPGLVKGYMTKQEVERTKSLYAGEVSFVDKWLGILLDYIKDLGLFENSIIMHTSDHGEPFNEHGIIRKARPWSYTEQIHIPWTIYHPGFGHGKRVKSMVQTTDMMPTILNATNLPTTFKAKVYGNMPQKHEKLSNNEVTLDGYNLLPLIKGETDKVRDNIIVGWAYKSWTIRTPDWSYHLYIDGSKPPELYNLKTDWWEQKNVIDKDKTVAKDLELKLRQIIDELKIK